jgi:hypothetical protein
MTASANRNNHDVPPVGRHRARLPRIAYSVAEYADMVGRRPDAVRRDIERKVRREGDTWIADLPLGVRAHKQVAAGRWAIVVPRNLVTE